MKTLTASALIMAAGLAALTPGWSNSSAGQNLPSDARARQNWILSCQGCHRSDATGTPQTTPNMAGFVAKFLQVPGGREYLVRVPGVATAALADGELAEVLNWSLARFDSANVPADFRPYTAEEVGNLRSKPLRVEAATMRAGMIAQFDDDKKK